MFSQALAAPLRLLSKRQTPTTALNAVQGGTTLGAVLVDPSTGTPTVSTTSSTNFYLSSGFLFASISTTNPHAFISYDNFGTSCGTSGPLVFTTSDSNKCSAQATFEFDGDELVFSTAGAFEVCGTDEHIAYTTTPSSPSSGCSVVSIVKA